MKGPDVMAKSKQTQERYAQAFQGQGKLTLCGFKAPSYPVRVKGLKTMANPPELMQDAEPDQSIVQLPVQPPVPISDEQPAKYWGGENTNIRSILKPTLQRPRHEHWKFFAFPTEVIQHFINRLW